MNREHSHNTEINISHDLSRRFSEAKRDRLRDFCSDISISSKVEMIFSNTRGVQ